jgi:hypothetical protein
MLAAAALGMFRTAEGGRIRVGALIGVPLLAILVRFALARLSR